MLQSITPHNKEPITYMAALVLLHENLAYRFNDKVLDQIAEVDYTQSISSIKKDIEYFRQYGMQEEQEDQLDE